MPHRLLLDGTHYLSLDGTNRLVLDNTPVADINQTIPAFTSTLTAIHVLRAALSQIINDFTSTFRTSHPGAITRHPLGVMNAGGRPRRAR